MFPRPVCPESDLRQQMWVTESTSVRVLAVLPRPPNLEEQKDSLFRHTKNTWSLQEETEEKRTDKEGDKRTDGHSSLFSVHGRFHTSKEYIQAACSLFL